MSCTDFHRTSFLDADFTPISSFLFKTQLFTHWCCIEKILSCHSDYFKARLWAGKSDSGSKYRFSTFGIKTSTNYLSLISSTCHWRNFVVNVQKWLLKRPVLRSFCFSHLIIYAWSFGVNISGHKLQKCIILGSFEPEILALQLSFFASKTVCDWPKRHWDTKVPMLVHYRGSLLIVWKILNVLTFICRFLKTVILCIGVNPFPKFLRDGWRYSIEILHIDSLV